MAETTVVDLPFWVRIEIVRFLSERATGSFTLEVKEGQVLKAHFTEYRSAPPIDKAT